jgi:hypothetical protein
MVRSACHKEIVAQSGLLSALVLLHSAPIVKLSVLSQSYIPSKDRAPARHVVGKSKGQDSGRGRLVSLKAKSAKACERTVLLELRKGHSCNLCSGPISRVINPYEDFVPVRFRRRGGWFRIDDEFLESPNLPLILTTNFHPTSLWWKLQTGIMYALNRDHSSQQEPLWLL